MVVAAHGSVELAAFVAVAMPRQWMEAGHAWLGLGEIPEGAFGNFIIRPASFTYGLHGVLMWLLSWDVVRFHSLVVFTGISYVVAAPVFLMIDMTSGMPGFEWSEMRVRVYASAVHCSALFGLARIKPERSTGKMRAVNCRPTRQLALHWVEFTRSHSRVHPNAALLFLGNPNLQGL